AVVKERQRNYKQLTESHKRNAAVKQLCTKRETAARAVCGNASVKLAPRFRACANYFPSHCAAGLSQSIATTRNTATSPIGAKLIAWASAAASAVAPNSNSARTNRQRPQSTRPVLAARAQ